MVEYNRMSSFLGKCCFTWLMHDGSQHRPNERLGGADGMAPWLDSQALVRWMSSPVRLGDAAVTSDEDTVLIFPRNFAPLPLSRRPYGTLSFSVPSAAA